MKRWVQGPGFDRQQIARAHLDRLPNSVTVLRPSPECLHDQHVKRSLQESGLFFGFSHRQSGTMHGPRMSRTNFSCKGSRESDGLQEVNDKKVCTEGVLKARLSIDRKLESATVPLEIIVVDRAMPPNEN